jgi:hypothetical protein
VCARRLLFNPNNTYHPQSLFCPAARSQNVAHMKQFGSKKDGGAKLKTARIR